MSITFHLAHWDHFSLDGEPEGACFEPRSAQGGVQLVAAHEVVHDDGAGVDAPLLSGEHGL